MLIRAFIRIFSIVEHKLRDIFKISFLNIHREMRDINNYSFRQEMIIIVTSVCSFYDRMF